jgi:deoxyribose-phosphate aldolase
MDAEALAARIDHTVLGPETTPADVERVLEEAAEYGMNACVPPCYVAEAVEHADGTDVDVVTVVGFPHGQHAPGVKEEEAVAAWDAGADEVDVVLNVGRLKAGDDEAVRSELAAVVAAVPLPVKVIVETALLAGDELERACTLAKEADADFVKTSTGFADGGARVEDVEVMSRYLPVKASGGVGSWADAKAMFDAGADRIGASSGVAIVEDFLANE